MAKYQSDYADKYIKSDECGKTYDKAISDKFGSFIWDFEKELLLKIHKKYFGKRKVKYLDFACGTGRIIGFCSKKFKFKDIIGLDTSEHMIEVARKSVKAKFIVGNLVEKPDLVSGEFDLITCFRLFLNLEDKNRAVILEALRKKLSGDGILIVNNHLNRYSVLGLIFKMRHLLGSKLVAETHKGILNTMGDKEFKKILDKSGFKVIETYRFIFLPGRKNLIVLPKSILFQVETFISKIPLLNYLGKDQIYVCQKK